MPTKKMNNSALIVKSALLAGLAAIAQHCAAGVSLPNGSYSTRTTDLEVKTAAGMVGFTREYSGAWRFNSQWESLSSSFKNPVLDAASSGAADGGGCWMWVDADADVSGLVVMDNDGLTVVGANSYLPFNRSYPMDVNLDEQNQTAPPANPALQNALFNCTGTAPYVGQVQAMRRLASLYIGDSKTLAFKDRYTLAQKKIKRIPSNAIVNGAALPLEEVELGYRWQDRNGDWVEYDDKGRVTSYGDKNNNPTWLQRDVVGNITRVVDQYGAAVLQLNYSNGYLTEVNDNPGNAQDAPARSVRYEYDSAKRLAKVIDARGNATSYTYDNRNRLTGITDPEGRTEQIAYQGESTAVDKLTEADGSVTTYVYSYDKVKKQFYSKVKGPLVNGMQRIEDYTHDRSGGEVKYEVNGQTQWEVTRDTYLRKEMRLDARGQTTSTTRNEFGNIVGIEYPDGAKISRSYEAKQLNLTEEIDELGIKTQYEYDAGGNLIKKTEAVGLPEQRITQYTVNAQGQVESVTRLGRTESNGVVTPDVTGSVTYDSRGNIASATDGEGRTTSFNYDRQGNLSKTTDANGNSWSQSYDALNNLVKMTGPLGRSTTYGYDKVGNHIQETDARGKSRQYAYDAKNRRIQTVNSVSGIYRVEYNGQGSIAQETDEDGRSTKYEYDAFLRMVKRTDGNGNVTQYAYTDDSGKPASTSAPNVTTYPTHVQQIKFDYRDRPTLDILLNVDAVNPVITNSRNYDKRGQVTSETDANGKTRSHHYDALGHLIATTDTLGNTTEFSYDSRDNLIQVKDAKGQITRYEFDRANRLIKETRPLGQATAYVYDAAGNLSEMIDAKNNKVSHAYDGANRLIETRRYGKASGTLVLQETLTYSYDDANNLTDWSIVDAQNAARNVSGSATYDDANRRIAETVIYPTLNGATTSLNYSASYGLAGNKTGIIYPDGTAINFDYSTHKQLQSVSIPNEGTLSVTGFTWTAPKTITLPGGSVQVREYNGLLNLTSFKAKNASQQIQLDVQNKYNKAQNLTDKAIDGQTVNYSYDDENHLIKVSANSGANGGIGNEAFTLDALGNRASQSQTSGTWQYDANNRLTQQGDTSYQYDANGNLIKKAVGSSNVANSITQYGYDIHNRLIEVTDGAGAPIAQYGYDLNDRRVWKDVFNNGTIQRTFYLYSDEGLIAESLQASVQGGASISQPMLATLYGWNPDNPFMTDPLFIRSQGTYAYYHNDHLGTSMKATDKDGNAVWSADSNSFGLANIDMSISTIVSNLRFAGQYFDQETGLHYNWHRYYDPSTGRYIQNDPIGLRGGPNTYAYAGSNPVSNVDPDGLQFIPLPLPLPVPPPPIPGPGPNPRSPGPTLPHWTLPDWMWDLIDGPKDARASGEEKLPIVNPGKDCDGNCKPCPPGKRWFVPKPGHGHANGYWHTIVYNQNKKTCMCYPDRPSGGLDGF